jgi:hypothetical protein
VADISEIVAEAIIQPVINKNISNQVHSLKVIAAI